MDKPILGCLNSNKQNILRLELMKKSTERSQLFRAEKLLKGEKELRGVFARVEHHKEIKKRIKQIQQELEK